MSAPCCRRYSARYIFPGDGPPLKEATVEITNGMVTGLFPRRDRTAEDLGPVALIPGLVNAHTHLEFSDLRQPLAPADSFTGWIAAVVHHRRTRPLPVKEVICRGREEVLHSGCTLLGDIATEDDAAARATPSGGETILFRELLGFSARQIETQRQAAQHFLAQSFPPGVLPGLSPHAPYSVHPDLIRLLVRLASEHNLPVAMHLAETPAERQLLEQGSGPLREMLQSFGVWEEGVLERGSKPLDYLRLLADAPRGLVIHGNYLDEEELQFLTGHPQLSLVYCPRTHAYFGHQPHPWQRVLQQGGVVALGTDSRASNPDLSLWNELCFLRCRHPDIPDAELLQLGTLNGARALGMEKTTGSITPGKRADLALVAFSSLDSSAAGGAGFLFHPGNIIRPFPLPSLPTE